MLKSPEFDELLVNKQLLVYLLNKQPFDTISKYYEEYLQCSDLLTCQMYLKEGI